MDNRLWQNGIVRIGAVLLIAVMAPKAQASLGRAADSTPTRSIVVPQSPTLVVARARIGKKAADRYFIHRKKWESQEDAKNHVLRAPAASGKPRYLALFLGTSVSDQGYKWGGPENDRNLGRLTAGVTYRLGEWTDSMDLALRADFESFQLQEGRAVKLSLLPVVTFPDADSGFPLYFGAGAGAGVFLKQIHNESSLSFDYQILAGVRLFNVVDSVGLALEVGMKNHILLLSDGQFNGTFASLGTVFAF